MKKTATVNQPQNRRRPAPWLVVLGLCILYLITVLIANKGDPLIFVMPGTRYSLQDPAGTEGYDGQFTYYIARDPAHAAPLIDVPAYRYQRILLPILGRILAFGQSTLLPWAFLLINLTALALATRLLQDILTHLGVSPWYALTYGLFAGVFMSVRLSLNEPLAYGLVLAALWLDLVHHRFWLSAGCFALAALAKETTLLFPAAYTLAYLSTFQWKKAVSFTVTTALPFAAWQIVLFYWLGAFGAGSGGEMATGFEIIPFYGFFRIYAETGEIAVFAVFALLLVPAVILPALWAVYRAARDLTHGRREPVVFALLVNAGIMAFVPFSTYREPLGMLRFMVGLMIAIVLYGALCRSQRILRFSTLWIMLILFALGSG